jgi:hypothetical protein
MKLYMNLNWRTLRRQLFTSVLAIVLLWAMPKNAHGRITDDVYLEDNPIHNDFQINLLVADRDGTETHFTLGSVYNVEWVPGPIQWGPTAQWNGGLEIAFADWYKSVDYPTLNPVLFKIHNGIVGEYNPSTNAAINENFIPGSNAVSVAIEALPMPEPSTWAMIVLGGVVLTAMKYWKKQCRRVTTPRTASIRPECHSPTSR